MCRKLLANMVIENYRIEKLETGVMAFRAAVVTFPGSNCDRDMAVALEKVSGTRAAARLARRCRPARAARFHRAARRVLLRRLPALRARWPRAARSCARWSTRPSARRAGARRVQRLPGADRGRPAARRADAQRRHTLHLPHGRADGRELASRCSPPATRPGQTIRMPVAHHDGNYFADDATLDRLEGEGRVAFRYAEASTARSATSPACSTRPATCWA